MKKGNFLGIIPCVLSFFFFVLFSFEIMAQTTEHFTGLTVGTTSYTRGKYPFALTGGNFSVYSHAGYGWTGDTTDDYYADNYNNCLTSAGVVGSYCILGATFKISQLFVFPGKTGDFVSNEGSIIIRGKLAGAVQYTITIPSSEINLPGYQDNGFTKVQMGTNASISVDQLEFEVTGALRYLAIDGITYTPSSDPPVVSTSDAASISTTSATLGGDVTSQGGSSVSERGIVYSTSDHTPAIGEAGVTKDINGSGAGVFSKSFSLTQGVTYYFQAYAINTMDTSYGGIKTVTLNSSPTVTTQAVNNIQPTTATGNGNITSLGSPNPTAYGVCWNTGGTPVTTDSKVDKGAASSTGAFTASMDGLTASTTYHVRAFATNTLGTSYGGEVTFKTAPGINSVSVPGNGTYKAGDNLDFTVNFSEAITVTGSPYIQITLNTGGTVNAAYQSGSGGTGIVFRYTVVAGNLDDDGVSAAATITLNSGTLQSSGGLDAELTLHNVGATTGILVDGAAPSISSVSAPANATYTTGQNLDFTVNYNKAVVVVTTGGSPYVTLTIGSSDVQAVYQSGSGTTALLFRYAATSSDIDADGIGLKANITLNGGTMKDAAGNNAGLTFGAVSYAGILVNVSSPTVTTQAVSSILTYTATGNGTITDLGSPNPTAYGVCWNTGGTPVTTDSKVDKGAASSTGAFTASMTGLSASTTYHVRAFATNAMGTSYGGEVTFKTAPGINSVTVPGNGTYKAGDNLDFTVNFSEAITVTGVPSIPITLNTGGTVNASYQSGSGGTGIVFRYTIVAGNLDNDGVSVGASISLNGGTLRSGSSVDAELTLHNVGGTAGVLVDGAAPSISSVSAPANATYTTGQNLDFTVNYNEAVAVVTTGGSPYITLTIGSSDVQAVYQSGTGTTALLFRYAVTSSDIDANGIDLKANITLNGGTMKDAAGNNAGLTFGAASYAGILVNVSSPTVTTQAVNSIGVYTATGNGNITSLGSPNPTAYGVCWNTGGTPVTTDSKVDKGAASSTGTFTASMTGLSANTTYHVRAFATNAVTTSYGSEVTFTTNGIAPTVTTQAVSSINSITATGNGNITDLGVPNPTQFGVVWSTATNPTIALLTKTAQGAASATGAFTSNITGLSANTKYYLKAYATNSAGTSYGSEVEFTTKGIVPTVTTQAVNNITSLTATGNGNITDLGVPNPQQYGVVWSTSTNPLVSLTTKTEQGAAAATGAFTSDITGLSASTTYYIKAYATNSEGTSYGEEKTFTTKAIAPTIQANKIKFTDVRRNQFTISWKNGNGAKRAVFMKEGTGPGAITNPTDLNTYLADTSWIVKGTQLGLSGYYCIFNGTDTLVSVTGLLANTKYCIQVFEYNGVVGDEKYLTSTDIHNPDTAMTTTAAPVALDATQISSTGFTANWQAPAGAAGYVLDVATDSLFTSFVAGYDSLIIGNVTKYDVTSLAASTRYYYRVRAINPGGVSLKSNYIEVVTNKQVKATENTVTSSSFVITWETILHAYNYFLDYSTANWFAKPVAGIGGDKVNNEQNGNAEANMTNGSNYITIEVGNSNSYILNGLTPGTNYYYRVRAADSAGFIISISDIEDAQTAAPISNTGTYAITYPDGKTRWLAGLYKYIEWKKTGGNVVGALQIEYSTDGGAKWNKVNSAPIAGIARYSWLVPNVNSKNCLLRLVNYYTQRVYDVMEEPFEIYIGSAAARNYPNPFNPTTKVFFRMEKKGAVSLKVYDCLGQEVAVLVDKELEAGAHEFEFNAGKLTSGVYFYNLKVNGNSETHKMILMK